MVSKEQILNTLRMVVDPELGINVVDLGLIYGVEVKNKTIDITMTLTTVGCPLHESMVEAVRHVAQMSDLTKIVDVHLVWDPPWTPERLTPSAKAILGQ
ncbi:MAG TPA: metal-sulfur cluster assembly factor [Bacteroidota bacterium]